MEHTIKKAIFPVAGLGTRLLPATKSIDKEMLPIVDKPLIQFAIEEAIASGIEEVILVVNGRTDAFERYFTPDEMLERYLERKQAYTLLANLQQALCSKVRLTYVCQPQLLGLGHAILCAKHLLEDQPFAVVLADDIIDSAYPCLKNLIAIHENTHNSVVAVKQIAPAERRRYGIVAEYTKNDERLGKIKRVVEKPCSTQVNSNLGIVGRYVFNPTIFSYLEKLAISPLKEVQLTDALQALLQYEQAYFWTVLEDRYDCGNKLGYLQAVVKYGLKHAEISAQFRRFLTIMLEEE